MINFTNNSQIFKMSEVEKNTFENTLRPLYINNEETIACYKAVRDYMVFTNKRKLIQIRNSTKSQLFEIFE